jgi:type II secretion system protein I
MHLTKAAAAGGSNAFTLIEVIAALAIVSIAVLGLLQFHLAGIRMADTARTTAMAILVAQEKAAETACGGWPTVGVKSGVTEMDGSQFNWRTEVTNLDSLQSCGLGRSALRQVCVDVMWRDGACPRTVQMTTYVADRRIP